MPLEVADFQMFIYLAIYQHFTRLQTFFIFFEKFFSLIFSKLQQIEIFFKPTRQKYISLILNKLQGLKSCKSLIIRFA